MRISDWSSDVCSSDLPVQLPDENLAVADLAGAGGLHHRLDHGVGLVVGDRDLELDLGQEIDHVLGAAVQLGVALLAAEALDLGDGDARHAGVGQRLSSEEHTSELQSLLPISYAVLCL